MKEFLKIIAEKIVPVRYQLALRYSYLRRNDKLDAEMLYVSRLLKRTRRFLDIGANVGNYSFHFSSIFNNVEAFEPISEITHRLQAIQNDRLIVHNVALSNKVGELQYHIPIVNGKPFAPRASLETREGECEIRTVTVKTVDCYNYDDVDLIKIDVEGHEQFVIEGAKKVIKKNMPVLIVEIEKRHIKNDIGTVFQCITNLNYSGFFLANGNLLPLSDFSYEVHQKPFLNDVSVSDYVNNFIFIPNKT